MNFHTNCNHCSHTIYSENPTLEPNFIQCNNCKMWSGKKKLWFKSTKTLDNSTTFRLAEEEMPNQTIEIKLEKILTNSEWWLG
jgi:hypothetical protein